MSKKRIAIFQYHWHWQIHSINLIYSLVESGFNVDIFFKQYSEDNYQIINIDKLKSQKEINYFYLSDNQNATQASKTSFIFKVKQKVRNITSRLRLHKLLPPINRPVINYINSNVLEQSEKVIAKRRYRYLIAIEMMSLFWANYFSAKYKTSCIYYSLEIYSKEHPYHMHNSLLFDLFAEELKKTKAIIIQDTLRAEYLLTQNNINKKDLLLLPVSLKGNLCTVKTKFIHKLLEIPEEKKIILYMGYINPEARFCFEFEHFENVVKQLSDDFVVVFHGLFKDDNVREKLINYSSNRLIFSNKLVDDDKLESLMASAHIGLVFYNYQFAVNEALTAFSSEKITYFMKTATPIIAFRNSNYEILTNATECGELIDNISELAEKITLIDNNYEIYSKNAHKAYLLYYQYDKNIQSIIRYLNNN